MFHLRDYLFGLQHSQNAGIGKKLGFNITSCLEGVQIQNTMGLQNIVLNLEVSHKFCRNLRLEKMHASHIQKNSMMPSLLLDILGIAA